MSAMKFVPTSSSFIRVLNEGETNMIHAQIQCITAMEFYKDFSMEELRLNDYLAKNFLVSISDETKQHFTLKSYKPYVAVIDLAPSCEDDSSVDCISSWPIRSSEPNDAQVKFHVESPRHSADLGQDSVRQSCSSSPAADRPVEASAVIQNSDDEITSALRKSLATCQEHTFDKFDVNNVVAQKDDISHNSDVSVSILNNDKPTNFPECLTSLSSESHAAGNDVRINSTSGICKRPFHSDNSFKDKQEKGLAAAGSSLIEKHIQNMEQNNDAKESAENGQQLREQCSVEGSKENSDELSDEISCLTELQKSISAAIGQTNNRELLGWVIVNELQASRNILQYQKLPLNLLRAEVKHRHMMTRQLMDLFQVITIYGQLHCLIEVALVEEFGFFCHLKRIMIAKSIESQSNGTSETRDRCDVRTDSPSAVFSPGSSVKSFKQRRRVMVVPEEDANDDVSKHVSDLYAQSLLCHEADVLMFSEPGKLFRFEVLPGSRFVESWRRRGSGVVSLFQDKAAEMVKIVVSHWSSKEDFSLILMRSAMKTKTAMSKNGLQLKFMGLEVSKCREKMRYFMIQFESCRTTKAFKKLLHSLTFLNISDHSSPGSGPTCCLDVVFKSHRIHEEFPSSMTGDETDNHMTYDDDDDDVTSKDDLNKDGFHDVDEFKWCSDGKIAPDVSPGTGFCVAEDLQTRRNSFPFSSKAMGLAQMPMIKNQELGIIGQRCGLEVMKTCNCAKMLKACSEKCLLDVRQTDTNNEITEIERKTKIVKDLVDNDCSEMIQGSSTEDHSTSLPGAEISCSRNLSAYAGENCTVDPSFCVYRKGSGDIDEDVDKTDATQDRLKCIPEGGRSHMSIDQDGGSAQIADRENCAFKLSPGSKYQIPSANDQELAGLKDETLLLKRGKIDDEDSYNVTTENRCRLSPTEVVHPLDTCPEFHISKFDSFKVPESGLVLNCDGFEQEASNVGSRNCDRAVENDVFESHRCTVGHADEINDTILIGKSEEGELVNSEKKLGFEELEVKEKQPLLDKAVADFLVCRGEVCEGATHLNRLLETVDANGVDISLEEKVSDEVLRPNTERL